jgi:hypothetical protein
MGVESLHTAPSTPTQLQCQPVQSQNRVLGMHQRRAYELMPNFQDTWQGRQLRPILSIQYRFPENDFNNSHLTAYHSIHKEESGCSGASMHLATFLEHCDWAATNNKFTIRIVEPVLWTRQTENGSHIRGLVHMGRCVEEINAMQREECEVSINFGKSSPRSSKGQIFLARSWDENQPQLFEDLERHGTSLREATTFHHNWTFALPNEECGCGTMVRCDGQG